MNNMNCSNNNQEDEQEAHETNRTETHNRSSKGSSIPNWYIAILGTVVAAIYLSNIILMNLSRTAG